MLNTALKSTLKIAFVLLTLNLAFPAFAYQVQPMIVEIDAKGKQSLITYRLQNPGNLALPVEVEVFKRTFDENQKEVLVPAERDFLVLPPQIEVPANGYQVFRAKYIGKPNLAQSDSYRIVFKQLPLSDEKAQSGVKMMFNFATLVFVSPKGLTATPTTTLDCAATAAINSTPEATPTSIPEATPAATPDTTPPASEEKTTTPAGPKCELTIGNSGDRVLDLSQYDYHFDDGNKVINWNQFQTITKGRFIMPGHKMTLSLSTLLEGKTTSSAKMVNLFETVE